MIVKGRRVLGMGGVQGVGMGIGDGIGGVQGVGNVSGEDIDILRSCKCIN